MAKLLRQLMAEELAKDLKGVDCFILFGYERITSEQAQLARRKLFDQKIKIKVVKNTIASVVFNKVYNKDFKDTLKGSVAMIYGGNSPVDVAKAMTELQKKFSKQIVVKVGYLSGQLLDKYQIEELSKTPSKEVLLGMLAGVIQSPIQQVAGIFTGAIQNISFAINGYVEKLEKSAVTPNPGTPTPQ